MFTMVAQYNNYGKFSITVNVHNIRCPYTIQSGILIDFYTISGLNLHKFSWQRLVVTHEMTCWNDWLVFNVQRAIFQL
jgi:hypothetical protein